MQACITRQRLHAPPIKSSHSAACDRKSDACALHIHVTGTIVSVICSGFTGTSLSPCMCTDADTRRACERYGPECSRMRVVSRVRRNEARLRLTVRSRTACAESRTMERAAEWEVGLIGNFASDAGLGASQIRTGWRLLSLEVSNAKHELISRHGSVKCPGLYCPSSGDLKNTPGHRF
jgi:hypothetical protein